MKALLLQGHEKVPLPHSKAEMKLRQLKREIGYSDLIESQQGNVHQEFIYVYKAEKG